MDYKTGINSERGTAGELRFCFEAYNRGLCPCVPWGDPACFDIVIINKKTGKPIITQVRTGSKLDHGLSEESIRYQAKATCMGDRVHLRDTNVQYLVIYIAELDAWYMVPVKDISATIVHVYPHKRNSRGQYEKFRDRWKYFGFSSDDQVLLN
jgi:hypothetical protein